MPLNETATKALNDLLKSVSLDNVTAENTGFQDLEEAYYLCEVEKGELTISKSSGNAQVKMTYKVVEDGFKENEQKSTPSVYIYDVVKGTKGRKIFKYYPLKDESSIQRFAVDMLKFEAKPGVPLIPKEAFISAEDIEDAIACLEGARTVINVSYARDADGNVQVNDQGQKNIFYNAISWARAEKIQLPLK